jgi:hypothetical protein
MEQELESLWRVVSDPSSTSSEIWQAWCRIREIISERADAGS